MSEFSISRKPSSVSISPYLLLYRWNIIKPPPLLWGEFSSIIFGILTTSSHTTTIFLSLPCSLPPWSASLFPRSLVSPELWCSFPCGLFLHLLPHFPTRPCFIWWIFHRPVETVLLLSHPIPRHRPGSQYLSPSETIASLRRVRGTSGDRVAYHMKKNGSVYSLKLYMPQSAASIKKSGLRWPQLYHGVTEWIWDMG